MANWQRGSELGLYARDDYNFWQWVFVLIKEVTGVSRGWIVIVKTTEIGWASDALEEVHGKVGQWRPVSATQRRLWDAVQEPWMWRSECEWLSVEEWEKWTPKESARKREANIELIRWSGWNENILLGLKHPSWWDLDVILVMASTAARQKERKPLRPLRDRIPMLDDLDHLLPYMCLSYWLVMPVTHSSV